MTSLNFNLIMTSRNFNLLWRHSTC